MAGTDVVGIAPLPKVIRSGVSGLRIMGFSAIANMAQGLPAAAIHRDHGKAMAPLGAKKPKKLVRRDLSA